MLPHFKIQTADYLDLVCIYCGRRCIVTRDQLADLNRYGCWGCSAVNFDVRQHDVALTRDARYQQVRFAVSSGSTRILESGQVWDISGFHVRLEEALQFFSPIMEFGRERPVGWVRSST